MYLKTLTYRQCHSGQASLLGFDWIGRTLGLPLGRIVDSRFSRRAVDSTHPSSPSGRPRLAESLTALSSPSVSGSLTRATHLGSRGIGQRESNFGSGSGFWHQRHSELHCHCSARFTRFARSAPRSDKQQKNDRHLEWANKGDGGNSVRHGDCCASRVDMISTIRIA